MENVLVRPAKPEDAEAMSRILSEVSQNSTKMDFKNLTADLPRCSEDTSLVAEIDGSVVGFMVSYVFHGGFGLERSAWIATLGVSPSFMGRGIGSLLAREIISIYKRKSIRHLFTAVRWDSVDLLSFFKTLGFDRSDFINLRKEM